MSGTIFLIQIPYIGGDKMLKQNATIILCTQYKFQTSCTPYKQPQKLRTTSSSQVVLLLAHHSDLFPDYVI